MKRAAWLVGVGITLVAFSCDPALSLEEALANKRCAAVEPRCLGEDVCNSVNVCVPPWEDAGGAGVAGAGGAGAAGAGGAGGRESIEAGMDTMSSDVPDAAGATPSCMRVLFRDRDGDGFGSDAPEDQETRCPSAGWVNRGGDCFDATDDNHAADVHKEQRLFFSEGYPRPGQPGEDSFDYDCSGVEEADPGNRASRPAGACTSASDPSGCATLGGRLPTQRSGASINPFCGSTSVIACNLMIGECVPQTLNLTDGPFRCH